MALPLLLLAGAPAMAEDVWVAARALLPGDILGDDDVAARALPRPRSDTVPATSDLVGMEVRRRVAAGAPLTNRDVGARTLVKANTTVTVIWNVGTLSLSMQGRALQAGALGEEIRVLNTNSSRTVRGIVLASGQVEVKAMP
jgi:flagella basal body P-ring formation protein FlgA